MKICHISTFEKSYCPTSAALDAYHKTDVPAAPAGEYPRVRIPGLVALDDGTLLAYAEYRQGNDWSAIDICMRRSTDGGRTWSERKLLVPGLGRNTCNNHNIKEEVAGSCHKEIVGIFLHNILIMQEIKHKLNKCC